MNIFTKMRQSLLIAAALLCAGGTFAQEAEYGVVWSQDFENAGTYTEGWSIGGNTTASQVTLSSGSNAFQITTTAGGNRTTTYSLANENFSSADDYIFEFDWGFSSAGDRETTFSLTADNTEGQLFILKNPAATATSTVYAADGTTVLGTVTNDARTIKTPTVISHFLIKGNTNGVTLTVTQGETILLDVTLSESLVHLTGFNISMGRTYGYMVFDDLKLSLPGASEGISTPSCSITGTYGTTRTVTITAGVGTEGTAAAATYYTIDGTEPTTESTLYEAPFTISESSIVKAISCLPDGTVSDVCEFAAEAGTVWPLNTDVVKIADLAGEEDVKNPVVANSYTNTGVLGNPEVSFSYTFNGEEVTLPYTVTEDGTLVATVTADGYASATETLEVKGSYMATRSIDFAAMSQELFVENYGETWADITEGVRLANWSKSYTYYGTTIKSGFTFDNFLSCSGNSNYPLHMIFGSGIGRGTGSTYTIVGGTEGDIAVYEMNESLAPTENYVKYVVPYMEDAKMSRVASGSQTIAKVTVYSPVRELTVTDGVDLDASGTYTSASYVRKFNTDYTYGTICLPFAPDAATCANYTFYKLSEIGQTALYFEEETEPKANVAYLYKLKDGVDAELAKTFTGGVTTISDIVTEPLNGWQLIGAFAKTVITEMTDGLYYAYYAEYNEKKDVLVKANQQLTVNPYRAYFKFVETADEDVTPTTATMRIVFGGKEGGAMDIQEVITPEQIDGAIFDLEGRPVQEMQKGQIYILGGKKVKK